eukprot:TRINITY_DN40562_c0_g3_i2.p1 TRINITY_DN40562_c0_g3~~TRINITY_DN40562_c0_g3_i2.p1  ORF type:complete len:812 (-),score=107.97 TRINITY_DN40562_c0_g3_i2:963-3398(-)
MSEEVDAASGASMDYDDDYDSADASLLTEQRTLSLQYSKARRRSCVVALSVLACSVCTVLIVAAISLFFLFGSSTAIPDGYCQEEFRARVPTFAENVSLWAESTVRKMTLEEKHRLVNGAGWLGPVQREGFYIGNTLAIPHLGVASIRMQDAMQGFRTSDARMLGRVTSWPCALALAATWDTNATWTWSQALATEFGTKGANVVLGPSVNVHRVAKGGRNAEYLSGEDPALGSPLAAAYVGGVQDGAGLLAVVKHFVLNQQETNRFTVDSRADERTRWEFYYQPFQAAVKAGVGAVMCSYNFVNGIPACENSETITTDLKQRMGFGGFVMSDWWAIMSPLQSLGRFIPKVGDAARAGTDQDMPGTDAGYFAEPVLKSLQGDRLDHMAERVLLGAARSIAWRAPEEQCRVGCNCDALLYEVNATSAAHVGLARTLAASGAVLLKNDQVEALGRPILPLASGLKVAVLGSACSRRQDAEAMVSTISWTSADYYVVGGSGRVLSPFTVSVLDGLQREGSLTLQISDDDDDIEAAKKAMQGADVALVCGGATTSEGADRASLLLDQDDFISQVVHEKAMPVVVLALAPGAILMPWRKQADAILLMFLSGQETGNAAADLLTGKVSPSGSLPVTIPESDADTLQPCQETSCEYKEKLRGGWHIYDEMPVAYPFGYGLSYTTFALSIESDWHVASPGYLRSTLRVQNTGQASGAKVVQLYLSFPPAEADKPPLVLAAYRKTKLLGAGESSSLEFSIGDSEISVWDIITHNWTRSMGVFGVKFGTSSRNMVLCAEVEVKQASGSFYDTVAVHTATVQC